MPPSITHPTSTSIGFADYPKLVKLLREAFDGTAQPGSTLPIVYDEFGVQTKIPRSKTRAYTNLTTKVAADAVSEATQADYYRQAIGLAFCQPNVRALFLFHSEDERDLTAWQSGVYYVDGTPKSSLKAVRAALGESRRGVIAACPGLELTVHPRVVQKGPAVYLVCDLDCSYTAELYRLPGKLLARKTGTAIGLRSTGLRLRVPTQDAKYRLRLSVVAPVNPGPSVLKLVPLRHG